MCERGGAHVLTSPSSTAGQGCPGPEPSGQGRELAPEPLGACALLQSKESCALLGAPPLQGLDEDGAGGQRATQSSLPP